MKCLRMKLFASMSIIVLVLSMLIVGVWAVEEGKQIHLKGSVDFTMSDNNLYIRDIRRRKAGSTEQGTTIDNFLPGFVESTSFILKLGPLEADSDFELVIDVVNTTETTYQVNTTYNVTNGTITASGKIEGDGVPLAQVTTADISGQIILNVEISVIGTVDIGEIEVPLDEYVPKIYDYFTFSKNSDGKSVTLTGFDSSLHTGYDLEIPSTVSKNAEGKWIEGNTFVVNAIANGASDTEGVFYNSDFWYVELPSTLKSIGDYAFYECVDIKKITLPESLTSIGNYVFYNCENTVINGINNSKGLTSIGAYAFYRCGAIYDDIEFADHNNLTSIGEYAFAYCDHIGGISLPSSIRNIGEHSFMHCYNASGILDLGHCTKLTSIGEEAFIWGAFTSAILPSSLTSLSDSLFRLCARLKSIVLPPNITRIGYSTFDGCAFTSIDLSEFDKLKSIGQYAFYQSDIEEIIFPSGLTSIEQYAFEDTALKSVTLPSGLTSLERQAFENLDYVNVENGNDVYHSDGNCVIETKTNTLVLGTNNSIIPSYITIIGEGAFYVCDKLTSVVLSSGVTDIKRNAFRGCSSLTSITLPEGLTSIGVCAFEDCTSLTSITLPEGLTSMQSYIFRGCSGLKEIIIDSEYVYTEATSISVLGDVLGYVTTVKVLTSLDDGTNSYITTNFPNVSTEVIEGKSYTVYSKN